MKYRDGYDVIVVGAGTAGAIAAIAAARTGAKTLVVEQYGSIGGVLNLGMSMLGASDAEGFQALGGIGGELLERLVAIKGGTAISVDPMLGSIVGQDPELTKLTLLDMAKEAGVSFLLHSFVVDVLMEGTSLKGIVVANKGGLETIKGECFVDCTGDADVVARSNGEFTFGREQDSLTQPVSAIFRVGGVKVDKIFDYLEKYPDELHVPDTYQAESHNVEYLRRTPGAHCDVFQKLILKAREAGEFDVPRERIGICTLPGREEVTINATRVQGIDGTNPDDLTRAEIESQRQIYQVMRFLRKYAPGFENAHIISTPFQVGVRETRHIKGSYTLNKDDILGGKDFDDQIGRGAYPLDIHDVKPKSNVFGHVVKGGGITLFKISKSYGIPFRCLIPIGVDNITVGGRSISATHEAAASIRGQGVCMVTGHAAGTIAALAALKNTTPSQLSITDVQTALLSQNVILERNVKIPVS